MQGEAEEGRPRGDALYASAGRFDVGEGGTAEVDGFRAAAHDPV